MTLISITTTAGTVVYINPDFIVWVQQTTTSPVVYEIAMSNGSSFNVSNLPALPVRIFI